MTHYKPQTIRRKLSLIQREIFDLLADNITARGDARSGIADRARRFLHELETELGVGGAR